MATQSKLVAKLVAKLARGILGCLAMLFAASNALALDTKPHVLVRFEITAPAFVRNLPQRSQSQQSLSEQLAAQMAERYAFADWPVTARDGNAKLGELVLRLEEDGTTEPNPSIVVRWYASFGANDVALQRLPLPEVPIYEPSNPNWDTNSRRDFETRVLSRMNEKTRSDAFYGAFFQIFIRNLSIASTVHAQSGDHVIDVPMQWRDMLLAPESVIVVRFKKTRGAVAEQGSLRLSPVTARILPQDPSTQLSVTMLRGSVDQALFAAQPLNLVSNWNDRLPELLTDAEVRCYIFDYKPVEFAGTAGGLVIDPTE